MKKQLSLGKIAFLQALGVLGYCSLVGVLFWKGNEWFGRVPNYWGPLLFLVLFSTSALVCAVLTLGQAAILVWKEKQVVRAIKLVAYTAGWLVGFTLLVMGMVLGRKLF